MPGCTALRMGWWVKDSTLPIHPSVPQSLENIPKKSKNIDNHCTNERHQSANPRRRAFSYTHAIHVYTCAVLLLVGWSINFYTTRGRLPSC